ncbi:hypothetical protein QZH41_007402 [Actinostola sp. cb2023]|nr:hypothetical protein QZH41_007402 [Actinostola sp. cb2023]
MNKSETCEILIYASYAIEEFDFFEKLLILNIFFNGFLTISATLGNGIIIVAILGSQGLQTPSYVLITSLAFTDILVGLVYHPFVIAMNAFVLQERMRS